MVFPFRQNRKKTEIDYIRCTFLLVCTGGIFVEPRTIQKVYSLLVPEHFCEPCAGHLYRHTPLSLSSSTRHRCARLKNETLPSIEALNRFYRMAEKEINHSHDIMLQNHHSLRNDHPITITDLKDNRKIKRMLRSESLNDQEQEFLIPYAEVTLLAAYLRLASDICEDIYRKGENHPLEGPLATAKDNLRFASCRHNSLIQNLQLTKLPKKFCQYAKGISINSNTNATKYVLSILKHAKKNIARILKELEILRDKANSCDLYGEVQDPESSNANLETKNLRKTQMQDDVNDQENNSRLDRRTLRSSISRDKKSKKSSKRNSNDDKRVSKRKRRRGKKNKRRHRKRNRKSKGKDKSKRKNKKQRKNKRRRNKNRKNKKSKSM